MIEMTCIPTKLCLPAPRAPVSCPLREGSRLGCTPCSRCVPPSSRGPVVDTRQGIIFGIDHAGFDEHAAHSDHPVGFSGLYIMMCRPPRRAARMAASMPTVRCQATRGRGPGSTAARRPLARMAASRRAPVEAGLGLHKTSG